MNLTIRFEAPERFHFKFDRAVPFAWLNLQVLSVDWELENILLDVFRIDVR